MEYTSAVHETQNNVRVLRKDPTSYKQILFISGVILILILIHNEDKQCKSPIRLWYLIETMLFLLLLITSLLSLSKEFYLANEFILKGGKMLIHVINIIWIFIGGYWIYNDSACYQNWMFAYSIIMLLNAIIIICVLVMIILLCMLLVSHYLSEKSHKN